MNMTLSELLQHVRDCQQHWFDQHSATPPYDSYTRGYTAGKNHVFTEIGNMLETMIEQGGESK